MLSCQRTACPILGEGEGAILDFAQNSFARTIFAFTLPLNYKNRACGMGQKYASRQKDPNCLLNKPNMCL